MKARVCTTAFLVVVVSTLSHSVIALDGDPYIHDPSTIMECEGKYYTFGTRGGRVDL